MSHREKALIPGIVAVDSLVVFRKGRLSTSDDCLWRPARERLLKTHDLLSLALEHRSQGAGEFLPKDGTQRSFWVRHRSHEERRGVLAAAFIAGTKYVTLTTVGRDGP